MKLSKLLKILGYVLVYAGVALIGFGILSAWWFEGFSKVQEILSPFNVINIIVMAITLAPGLFLIWVSEKLEKRVSSNMTTKAPHK